MTLYTRRQILVLLILLTIAGLGMAVGHWRRAKPDVADYLEQLDRAPTPGSSGAAPQSDGRSPSPAPPDSEPEPRRARCGKAPRASATARASTARGPLPAIDLNRATVVELTQLPGIGSVLARRIVHARDAEGPFARVDELGRVRGLSARKLEQLRTLVTIAE